MAETLATLIDKLVVVHLKYWHFQDEVQKCKKEGRYEDFAIIQTKIDKCNQNRNKLMAEIDELYSKNLSGEKPVEVFEHLRFHDHNKVKLKKREEK
jgi:hypothetical protein